MNLQGLIWSQGVSSSGQDYLAIVNISRHQKMNKNTIEMWRLLLTIFIFMNFEW